MLESIPNTFFHVIGDISLAGWGRVILIDMTSTNFRHQSAREQIVFGDSKILFSNINI